MEKYVCTGCGYIYDPQKGDPDRAIIPPVEFENLPQDWNCPICYAGKDAFDRL